MVDVISLRSLLMECPLRHHTRELVIEACLHNLILSLVHKFFFEGNTFFGGVGSESLQEHLETMYQTLIEGGKSSLP
jgi:hypothetical protein